MPRSSLTIQIARIKDRRHAFDGCKIAGGFFFCRLSREGEQQNVVRPVRRDSGGKRSRSEVDARKRGTRSEVQELPRPVDEREPQRASRSRHDWSRPQQLPEHDPPPEDLLARRCNHEDAACRQRSGNAGRDVRTTSRHRQIQQNTRKDAGERGGDWTDAWRRLIGGDEHEEYHRYDGGNGEAEQTRADHPHAERTRA